MGEAGKNFRSTPYSVCYLFLLLVVFLWPSAGAAMFPPGSTAVVSLPVQDYCKIPLTNIPSGATGVMTGSFTSPIISSDSGDTFDLGYHFHSDITDHTYGIDYTLDFNASGSVTYNYTIPYSISFDLPDKVFPGMEIPLIPVLTPLEGASLTAFSDMSFGFQNYFSIDAPFDGFDDASVTLNQQPGLVAISGAVPLFTGVNATSYAVEVTSAGGDQVDVTGGFAGYGADTQITASEEILTAVNEGYMAFGGNYIKAAGTGTIDSSGNGTTVEGGAEYISLRSGAGMEAWSTGSDQIDVIHQALQMIPTVPTEAIGLALGFAEDMGDFDIWTTLDMGIIRNDTLNLRSYEVPLITVPDDWSASTWSFVNMPVDLSYEYSFVSTFGFPVSANITFDMRGMDEKALYSADLGYIGGGVFGSDTMVGSSSFDLTGNIPVVSYEDWYLEMFGTLPPTSTHPFFDDMAMLIGYRDPDTGALIPLPRDTDQPDSVVFEGDIHSLLEPASTNLDLYEMREPFWEPTATPEPSTFLLLGTGLLGLVAVSRRGAKKG